MASVLLIGRRSFLAEAFQAAGQKAHQIHAVPHDTDLRQLDLAAFDAVVNMAYDPRILREPYQHCADKDLEVAHAIAAAGPRGPHFFMMSSRKVYGASAPFPCSEDTAPAPSDTYGHSKVITEGAVRTVLGARCTIVRLANIFGFEPGRHTFFGIAMQRLRSEGRIVLDVSPFTRRDFLAAADFGAILSRLIGHAPGGTVNLGAGAAFPIGQLALWLIEGYGAGELVVTAPTERDAFLLDLTRLTAIIGDVGVNPDMRSQCIELGKRLK